MTLFRLIFRYSELVAIHGKLDPLVNVDLTPEKRVKVTFTYGDLVEVSNFVFLASRSQTIRVVVDAHNECRPALLKTSNVLEISERLARRIA